MLEHENKQNVNIFTKDDLLRNSSHIPTLVDETLGKIKVVRILCKFLDFAPALCTSPQPVTLSRTTYVHLTYINET